MISKCWAGLGNSLLIVFMLVDLYLLEMLLKLPELSDHQFKLDDLVGDDKNLSDLQNISHRKVYSSISCGCFREKMGVRDNIHYESIYRLVLLTHQSRGPAAGAIAGKRRSGILGPRSPLNQPCWVLALAIPAP